MSLITKYLMFKIFDSPPKFSPEFRLSPHSQICCLKTFELTEFYLIVSLSPTHPSPNFLFVPLSLSQTIQ